MVAGSVEDGHELFEGHVDPLVFGGASAVAFGDDDAGKRVAVASGDVGFVGPAGEVGTGGVLALNCQGLAHVAQSGDVAPVLAAGQSPTLDAVVDVFA